MKNNYIQHKVINIPQTTGTSVYSTLFKADDCYKYLSGIATVYTSNTAPVADDIKIEVRSDFDVVLSFSPFNNWLKTPTSHSWNLQDMFKPLFVDARGRNFWLNVKVTNCSAFSFVALFKQSIEADEVIRYDQQSFDIAAPALGQGFEITLPSDYNRVKGMMLTGGDSANVDLLAFEVFDSAGQIIDPLPMNALTPTIFTPYDLGFFPVDFESKSRQIQVRLTALDSFVTPYTPTDYTVTFLLV
jgi:hypothetical protein